MKIFINMLAFVCYICPLCIIGRGLPNSKFAGGMKKFGKICPFYIAYRKVKAIE